jgi:hypothetical protein
MSYRSTKEVARMLHVEVGTLTKALWLERIAPPERGPGNAYLWTDYDIERAARYFCVKLDKGTDHV